MGYIYIYIYINEYIYIYVYIFKCVCVCEFSFRFFLEERLWTAHIRTLMHVIVYTHADWHPGLNHTRMDPSVEPSILQRTRFQEEVVTQEPVAGGLYIYIYIYK